MDIDNVSSQNQAQVSLISPSDWMKFILTNNFDVVSIPAIITAFKYLANIVAHPNDDKYLTINTKNKVFLEKVYKAKGAVDFLKSIGFQSDQYGNLTLKNQSNPNISSNIIQSSIELLHDAMNELQIPEDERPKINLKSNIAMNESTKPVSLFDPYKTYIVRNNAQPIRQDDSITATTTSTASNKFLSTTEMQLLELEKRRLQIEGKVEDVERQTEVIYPQNDGTIPSMSVDIDGSEVLMNEMTNESRNIDSSKRIVQKEVLQRIIAMKKPLDDDSSGPPLTTQAIKDLQKAQKERIYNRTLIRIKFPDRVCLQGYFHPRHCIIDVYNWINSCLVDNISTSSKEMSMNNKKVEYTFELYISPPRTVLKPLKEVKKIYNYSQGNNNTISNNNDVNNISHSLFELKLVPATLIYLSWKSSTIITDTKTENSSASSLGKYLKEDIINIADNKHNSNHKTIAPLTTTTTTAICSSYPTSELLTSSSISTTKQLRSADESDLILHTELATASSKAASSNGTKSNKPKWFKT